MFAHLYNITILIGRFSTCYLDTVDADILVSSPLMGEETNKSKGLLLYFFNYFEKSMLTDLQNTAVINCYYEIRFLLSIKFN